MSPKDRFTGEAGSSSSVHDRADESSTELAFADHRELLRSLNSRPVQSYSVVSVAVGCRQSGALLPALGDRAVMANIVLAPAAALFAGR
jgi:hypothetical protein